MSTTPTPQVASSYLAQLEIALHDVEPGVRDEIVGGIREELDGLGAADAASRIEELGDPEFIAAEARAASPAPVAPIAALAPPSVAFPIVISLLVMSGGLIFPLIGGLVGLALMTYSRAWTRTEKIVAWLVPVAGLGVSVVVEVIETMVARQQVRFEGPSIQQLEPQFGLHLSFLVLLGLFIVDGVWLLTRVLRRR